MMLGQIHAVKCSMSNVKCSIIGSLTLYVHLCAAQVILCQDSL